MRHYVIIWNIDQVVAVDYFTFDMTAIAKVLNFAV